ncbi:MAG: glycoside hydrolase family 2 protein [Cyclobacteriaceae bacterium]|nr:glycoside hydrolase family 2 protein [Cyclobacteriaceae bacterium]
MYKVATSLSQGGEETDAIENPLGFRFFHWDFEDNHLVVNGEKINIKGTNRHQEYPWLGDAIPKWMHKMDMEDIALGLGHNFIRLTHYPNDKYLYELTDSLGIITVEEVPNIKNIDFDEDIQRQNVIEMIRRDRNHPSIFFWSMGNETSDAADSKWAWEEDTTRILHLRKGEEGGDFITHTHKNLEMESMLRVVMRGWFGTDDSPASINPSPENGQHCSSETWEHQMARVEGGSIRGLMGKNAITWLYADHGADREYLNCPLQHFNAKGLVDLYRQPKYIYHLTRANYTDKPMIYVHPHFWRSKYVGTRQNIMVDSNCDEVSLFVNDQLIETKKPSKDGFFTLEFNDVTITSDGVLKAIGSKNGQQYPYEVRMPAKPHRIVATSAQSRLPADRSGIAIIKADILDAHDVPVFDATNTLHWEIAGPGSLVGPKVYESDINKLESKTGTGYGVVPVCNVVRTSNVAGELMVIVSSPGLISDTILIESVKPADDQRYIEEVALDNDARAMVKKDTTMNYVPLVEVEIVPIRENHPIVGADFNSYRNAIDQFIKSRNRWFNQDAYGYQVLLDVLAKKMVSMQGELIADDYNFIINQYNQYYELEKQINRGTGATEEDKVEVLKPYAKSIIEQSAPVDVEREKLRIRNMHF